MGVPNLGDSWVTCLLTEVASLQHLPHIRGMHRHDLAKERNLTQEGKPFHKTTCCTIAASFLATVTLDNRGILDLQDIGWLAQ